MPLPQTIRRLSTTPVRKSSTLADESFQIEDVRVRAEHEAGTCVQQKKGPDLEPHFVIVDFEAVEWIEFGCSSPKLDSASIHPKPKFFFLIPRGPKEGRARDNDTTAFDFHRLELRYCCELHFNVQTCRR